MSTPPARRSSVCTLSPTLLLGLATAPVLLGLVSLKLVSERLQALGQLSEEWFRGDRLPTLDLHPPEASQTPDSQT